MKNKILNREFTRREKILLLIFAVVLLGGIYYYFVDYPVRNGIREARSMQQSLQAELKALNTKEASLKSMKEELKYMKEESHMAVMGTYNNIQVELEELNSILQQSQKYDITFQNSTREGNLIRKYFSMSFTTAGYEEAQERIVSLYRCPWRCLISDIKVEADEREKYLHNSRVKVTISAIFYETLYGGTADKGLPADTGK